MAANHFKKTYTIDSIPMLHRHTSWFNLRVLSTESPDSDKIDGQVAVRVFDENNINILNCETKLNDMVQSGSFNYSVDKKGLKEAYFYSLSNVLSRTHTLTRCDTMLQFKVASKFKKGTKVEFTWEPIKIEIDAEGEFFISQGGFY